MTRKTNFKPWKSRRVLALLLALSCLSFALPSLWFCRTVLAEGPLPETGNHVYHDDEYFELYQNKLEYNFDKEILNKTHQHENHYH